MEVRSFLGRFSDNRRLSDRKVTPTYLSSDRAAWIPDWCVDGQPTSQRLAQLRAWFGIQVWTVSWKYGREGPSTAMDTSNRVQNSARGTIARWERHGRIWGGWEKADFWMSCTGLRERLGRCGCPDGGWHQQGCGHYPQWGLGCMLQTINQHLITVSWQQLIYFPSFHIPAFLLALKWSPRAQLTSHQMNI